MSDYSKSITLGPFSFQFVQDGRELFRILPDGQVVVANYVTLDEASKAFWDAVQRAKPTSPGRMTEE